MNDLIIEKSTIHEWAMKTAQAFQDIQSFEDIERLFLRDQGLSGNTYSAYRASVQSCYTHLAGLHPLQWTPPEIESYYDHERKRNGIATASLRISGLKNFCKTIQARLPFWPNPFDVMSEKTKRKLSTPPKPTQKAALYGAELRAVLAELAANTTLKGEQNRAIILTLVTTGLRAQELCDLNGSSLEHDPDSDIWYLAGVGKGSKPYRQEIHPDAVSGILGAFRRRMNRDPRPDDPLFISLESYNGKKPERLTKQVLWIRLRAIGDDLKARGIIRREIEFSAHLFRRTYLTLLSKAGMSLRALQGISRHASIEVLAKHYVDDRESPRPYLDQILKEAV